MMNGLGFFIWRLKNLGNISDTVAKVRDIGVKWVSIKVREGVYKFNYVDQYGNYTGKNDYLLEVIEKFKSVGIEVGTWHFVYTDRMVDQGKAITDAIRELGMSHLLIDAENVPKVGSNWFAPGVGALATAYMNALRLPSGFPVGLCSYRFPSYQPGFPFKEFLNHRTMNLNAPQVYWIQAHNPGDQVRRSYIENSLIRDLPFYPVGATFQEWGWQPTVAEIEEFINQCKKLEFPGWSFWSLDQALNRPDWLAAVAEQPLPEPEPEPEPEPQEFPTMKVQVDGLRVRSEIIPSVKYGSVPGKVYPYSKVWFLLHKSAIVEVIETIEDGQNLWARVGQRQFVAIKYDDIVYLA